jgi:hypothetical protein
MPISKFMPRFAGLSSAAALLASGWSVLLVAAPAQQVAFPLALRGIWYSDDAAGKAQCKSYLAVDKSNSERVLGTLVGAVVIDRSIMHDYAEYGEGNFYALRRLKASGRNGWFAGAATGIDAEPEASQPEDQSFKLQLAKGRLTASQGPTPRGATGTTTIAYKLARCAGLPK